MKKTATLTARISSSIWATSRRLSFRVYLLLLVFQEDVFRGPPNHVRNMIHHVLARSVPALLDPPQDLEALSLLESGNDVPFEPGLVLCGEQRRRFDELKKLGREERVARVGTV